jgi:hypothetical protein
VQARGALFASFPTAQNKTLLCDLRALLFKNKMFEQKIAARLCRNQDDTDERYHENAKGRKREKAIRGSTIGLAYAVFVFVFSLFRVFAIRPPSAPFGNCSISMRLRFGLVTSDRSISLAPY